MALVKDERFFAPFNKGKMSFTNGYCGSQIADLSGARKVYFCAINTTNTIAE